MTSPKSEFLQRAMARGFVYQVTDVEGLDAAAVDGCVNAYIGFDCTAPSLHVGSLTMIMLLRILQQTGHRPIVLMGGGTTKVGDPSGKDESRQLLDDEQISENLSGIKNLFERFLKFGDGPQDAIMVNNADWLDDLDYIPFLRDVGRHFSINRMLRFDSVKLRLEREQPLTFLEFNYMILQAYDFLELGRRFGCTLQMGGSDQWGNIVNGVELGRRIDNRAFYGLTTPLLTTADGGKMGKTAAGAVWLNADLLNPFDYWQFWRNANDADVGRFLRLFTEVPDNEIERIELLEGAELNDAKKLLATEATRLCHGDAAADNAEATAHQTFEQGAIATDLPTIDIDRRDLDDGIAAFELFRRIGMCGSGGEARRLIRGGGGRINDVVVVDEQEVVTAEALTAEGVIKVSVGRKRHVLVRPDKG